MAQPRRCGLYVRVSSSDQNCDLQIKELREYVSRRGWTIHKVYEDKASGANPNRKMLSALLNDCRIGRLDIVLIWKLDRLFRSLKNMIATFDEISGHGVDFISISDGVDLCKDSPTSRLMLHLISAFSEFELNLIRSRVVAGLQAAKARGQKLGRPSAMTPEIEAEILRLRFGEALSYRAIEQKLNRVVSKASIERVIKSVAPKRLEQNPTKTDESSG